VCISQSILEAGIIHPERPQFPNQIRRRPPGLLQYRVDHVCLSGPLPRYTVCQPEFSETHYLARTRFWFRRTGPTILIDLGSLLRGLLLGLGLGGLLAVLAELGLQIAAQQRHLGGEGRGGAHGGRVGVGGYRCHGDSAAEDLVVGGGVWEMVRGNGKRGSEGDRPRWGMLMGSFMMKDICWSSWLRCQGNLSLETYKEPILAVDFPQLLDFPFLSLVDFQPPSFPRPSFI
jgi:hypothetical protein